MNILGPTLANFFITRNTLKFLRRNISRKPIEALKNIHCRETPVPIFSIVIPSYFGNCWSRENDCNSVNFHANIKISIDLTSRKLYL
jgi:hypothetical protein